MKDLKTSVSVLSRTNHKRLPNTAAEQCFLTFPILYSSHYYIKDQGSQHNGNKRTLYYEKDMEMFTNIVLHLSLTDYCLYIDGNQCHSSRFKTNNSVQF